MSEERRERYGVFTPSMILIIKGGDYLVALAPELINPQKRLRLPPRRYRLAIVGFLGLDSFR